MSDKVRVGLVGVGMMGKPMAMRILSAGYPLTVYDIRPESLRELNSHGANPAGSPKEVAIASDVVLTSLPSLAACEQVYLGTNGLMLGARPGQTFVETSTVPPNTVRKFADEGKKQGVVVIDAALIAQTLFNPGVAGLKADEIVSRGQVTVLVGAEAAQLEKVRPVLASFGNPVLHLGPVGSGVLIKVLNNAIAHANFAVACEVYALGAKAGVNIRTMHDLLTKAGARSAAIEHSLPHYLQTGTGKLMRTEAAIKDSESVLQLGREFGLPMLMQSVNHAYYEMAKCAGLMDRPGDEILKLWERAIGKPIRFE